MPHGIGIHSPLQPVFEKKPKASKKPKMGITPDDRQGPSPEWVGKEMRRRGTSLLNQGVIPRKPRQI